MSTPPRKETISSRISARLRSAILRGDLAPGAKINLDRLREDYDVSISPLREAVSRLMSDGLVEFEDQRGYSVAPISAANLREITLLRAELDVLALRMAIEQGDLEWESDVMRALYRLTHAKRDAADAAVTDAWEAAHTEFHMALLRGCKMPLLLHFCVMLQNMNDRYRRLYLQADVTGRDIGAEHTAIATAATSRDVGLACSALQDHILATGNALAHRLGAV